MITFKQFLIESRSAPLYHGTKLHTALEIIESGKILPNTSQLSHMLLKTPYRTTSYGIAPSSNTNRPVVLGVSTTRNKNFAVYWATSTHETNNIAVFEFDQAKLTQRFEIKPFNFYGATRYKERVRSPLAPKNEYEEFVITNKGIPIQFVSKIYSNANIDLLRQTLKKQGLSIPVVNFRN